ncbi:MAG TPA: DEAD/DEAH box helicase [Pantanalinema sp.]
MPDNIRFEDLGLPPEILRGLSQMGFTYATPVQAAAIPEVMKGKDLVVQAKTGSGKTLAFGLPVLARLDPTSPNTQVLVITPTRELAIQVAEELNKVGGHLGVLVAAIYGGTRMDKQMTDLAWASIIVGTPGRLRDHLTRGNMNLTKCTTVILDEADEMLDMGFKDDLEFILSSLPKPRTTLLFSATFAKAIEAIARKYMTNIEKIAVSSGLTTPTDITHRFLKVTESNRVQALATLIRKEPPNLGIVFCKRKSETTQVSRKLRAAGIPSGYLNGDMDQSQREATLAQFKRGEINILVATDVAARGLDINGITHVYNISVPQDTETYVHRSGRTGRAGKKGTCITLVTPEDERNFTKIQQDLTETARKQMAAAEAAVPAQAAPARRPAPEPRAQELAPAAPRERQTVRQEIEPARPAREAERRVESRVESRAIEPARPRFSVETIYREVNGQAEAYRTIAQELLRQTDAERLVAALLSQTSAGKRMLEKSVPREEKQDSNREPSRRRSRSTSHSGGRLTRKPSQVVYGE